MLLIGVLEIGASSISKRLVTLIWPKRQKLEVVGDLRETRKGGGWAGRRPRTEPRTSAEEGAWPGEWLTVAPGPGGAGMLAGESLLSLLLRPSLLSLQNPPGYGGGAHRGRAGAVEASAEERKASSPEQKELLSPGPSYS